MKQIMAIWTFFSGKKTVIAALLKAAADALTAVGQIEAATLADHAGNALLMIGLTHKTTKRISK